MSKVSLNESSVLGYRNAKVTSLPMGNRLICTALPEAVIADTLGF